MIEIDKRKFLTELGKLLTIMYEEDSRTAIAMYEQMFSECTDESALISFLGSPTKQAVTLARCYNSKEKSLGVTSEHGAGDAAVASGRTPAFVQAILDLREKAVSSGLIYAVQPVYFDNDTIGNKEVLSEVEEPAPVAAVSDQVSPVAADDFDLTGISSAPRKVSADPFGEIPDFTAEVADSFGRYTLDLGPADPTGSILTAVPEDNSEEEEVSTYTVDEDQLMMDGFGNLANAGAAQTESTKIVPGRAAATGEKPAKKVSHNEKRSTVNTAEKPGANHGNSTPSKPVTINIAVVILYLLVAIPIVAAGVLLLLLPALVFLALSVFTGLAAFNVISAAFGSFAVFADILVVLGAGLLLSAFALLFLLIFAWFIGCAIAGLINGAIRLGGRICCKEGNVS